MSEEKNRKSASQEIYEQAENAGRFAGDDADASAAREQAGENIRQDTGADRSERNRANTNEEAHRDPTQSQDHKGEAQNVNDDAGRPLEGPGTEHARNKASEGLRQGRNDT